MNTTGCHQNKVNYHQTTNLCLDGNTNLRTLQSIRESQAVVTLDDDFIPAYLYDEAAAFIKKHKRKSTLLNIVRKIGDVINRGKWGRCLATTEKLGEWLEDYQKPISSQSVRNTLSRYKEVADKLLISKNQTSDGQNFLNIERKLTKFGEAVYVLLSEQGRSKSSNCRGTKALIKGKTKVSTRSFDSANSQVSTRSSEGDETANRVHGKSKVSTQSINHDLNHRLSYNYTKLCTLLTKLGGNRYAAQAFAKRIKSDDQTNFYITVIERRLADKSKIQNIFGYLVNAWRKHVWKIKSKQADEEQAQRAKERPSSNQDKAQLQNLINALVTGEKSQKQSPDAAEPPSVARDEVKSENLTSGKRSEESLATGNSWIAKMKAQLK